MKITAAQLSVAASLAERIASLEHAKDGIRDEVHTFRIGIGETLGVPVPAAAARAEVAKQIESATAHLASMGFELLPPEVSAANHVIDGNLIVTGALGFGGSAGQITSAAWDGTALVKG